MVSSVQNEISSVHTENSQRVSESAGLDTVNGLADKEELVSIGKRVLLRLRGQGSGTK
jgi:hypothetical protein